MNTITQDMRFKQAVILYSYKKGVTAAGKQLVRQAVAVLIAVVCINVAVFARYDRKGERRASWRELLGRDD